MDEFEKQKNVHKVTLIKGDNMDPLKVENDMDVYVLNQTIKHSNEQYISNKSPYIVNIISNNGDNVAYLSTEGVDFIKKNLQKLQESYLGPDLNPNRKDKNVVCFCDLEKKGYKLDVVDNSPIDAHIYRDENDFENYEDFSSYENSKAKIGDIGLLANVILADKSKPSILETNTLESCPLTKCECYNDDRITGPRGGLDYKLDTHSFSKKTHI